MMLIVYDKDNNVLGSKDLEGVHYIVKGERFTNIDTVEVKLHTAGTVDHAGMTSDDQLYQFPINEAPFDADAGSIIQWKPGLLWARYRTNRWTSSGVH